MKQFSYIKIAQSIYQEFIQNKLKPGDVLPTEHFLIEYYKVSRTTLRNSIQQLIKENIVYSIQGSGTFVKAQRKDFKITQLDNFFEYAQQVGGIPTTKVSIFEIIPAPLEVAQLLHIEEKIPVYHTKRLRLLDEEPIVFEIGYMPVYLFPDLSFEVMSKSKYDYIEKQKQMIIKNSHIHFSPIILDEEIADLLNTVPNMPAVCIKTQSFLNDGTLFEYTEAIRNPQKYDIMIETYRLKNQL